MDSSIFDFKFKNQIIWNKMVYMGEKFMNKIVNMSYICP